MDGSQLPVFTHEYLGPQYLVETHDVNKAKSRSNVPFIRKKKKNKKIQGSKLWQYNEITIKSERNTKNDGVVKLSGHNPCFREKKT